jgi:hypothetical protein
VLFNLLGPLVITTTRNYCFVGGLNMELIEDRIDRVRMHTSPETLQEIDDHTEQRVRLYANQSRETISRRIDDLDREWDIERVLETNASALALSGVVLGVLRGKKWLFLSGAVLGFLLWHALRGWCPPIPLLRKLGVRTRREIDREKYALKALRGDFERTSMELNESRENDEAVERALESTRI